MTAEVISLPTPERVKTINNLRISIRNSKQKNGDGRYNRLLQKEQNLLQKYWASIFEAA